MYNYTGVFAAGESDPVPLADLLHAPYSFYLVLLFHEHLYVNWQIVRMWAEKEGALERKETDISLFKALLIIFPIEGTLILGLTATEVKRSLLGCTGSQPRRIRQCSVRLLQIHPRHSFGAGVLFYMHFMSHTGKIKLRVQVEA